MKLFQKRHVKAFVDWGMSCNHLNKFVTRFLNSMLISDEYFTYDNPNNPTRRSSKYAIQLNNVCVRTCVRVCMYARARVLCVNVCFNVYLNNKLQTTKNNCGYLVSLECPL